VRAVNQDSTNRALGVSDDRLDIIQREILDHILETDAHNRTVSQLLLWTKAQYQNNEQTLALYLLGFIMPSLPQRLMGRLIERGLRGIESPPPLPDYENGAYR
jgi:hypothetical protein